MPAALKDSQVSVRLPNDLKDKMEAYAVLTGRSKSYVAMEALSVYLEGRIPQIEDLKAAVQEADQGEFASDDEVGAVLAKYSGPTASRPTSRKSAAPRRAK
jgi:RHH-type transcriptional regulator, rel operon repressor / antitoxin RelB